VTPVLAMCVVVVTVTVVQLNGSPVGLRVESRSSCPRLVHVSVRAGPPVRRLLRVCPIGRRKP
jgi:hypothetical protein